LVGRLLRHEVLIWLRNLDLAPPPKTVDGLAAVPIDIESVDGALVFDAAASAATGDATITYTVADDGQPHLRPALGDHQRVARRRDLFHGALEARCPSGACFRAGRSASRVLVAVVKPLSLHGDVHVTSSLAESDS
jgi:hypothetical protein